MTDFDKINNKELRKFAFTTGGILAGLFGAFFPWLLNVKIPHWPWVACAILVVWAIIHAPSLKPVYINWIRFGHALGWVNSRIILGIMFYLIFLPISILLKILGKDPMHKKLDPAISSYRVTSQKKEKEHIERPF